MYTTKLKFGGTNLSIPLLKDFGFSFVDGDLQVCSRIEILCEKPSISAKFNNFFKTL